MNLILTKMRIKKAIEDSGIENCALACSWGKDSQTVFHLIYEQYPQIKVVHCNTGVDHPLTYKFRDMMLSKYDINYYELKGKMTFWEIVDVYGLPGIRLKDGERVPKCCKILKDDPADEWYKENNIKCVFTGITASESRNRFMLSKRCGDYYFAKSQGRWKAHPIMDWSVEDVWNYLKDYPKNEFYIKFPNHRVGCMPCTSYLDWKNHMAKENPKLYKKIQNSLGQEVFD